MLDQSEIDYRVSVETHFWRGGAVEMQLIGNNPWTYKDAPSFNWVECMYRKKPRTETRVGWINAYPPFENLVPAHVDILHPTEEYANRHAAAPRIGPAIRVEYTVTLPENDHA